MLHSSIPPARKYVVPEVLPCVCVGTACDVACLVCAMHVYIRVGGHAGTVIVVLRVSKENRALLSLVGRVGRLDADT